MEGVLLLVLALGGGGGLFDVVDFGARGDGITDDGPAIAKAYAACSAAGGGTVVFPPGPIVTATATASLAQSHVSERVFRTGPIALACNHSVTRISAGSVVMALNTTVGWPLGPESAVAAPGPRPQRHRGGRRRGGRAGRAVVGRRLRQLVVPARVLARQPQSLPAVPLSDRSLRGCHGSEPGDAYVCIQR